VISHGSTPTLSAETTEAASRPTHRHWTVALGSIVATAGAVNAWWLVHFRDGYPVDIDEAGYLWFAFRLRHAFDVDGLSGWWNSFQHEGWVGPLLPSVTGLMQLVTGSNGIVPAMAVQLVFFAILVVASYGIGSRLLDRRAGLLTAATVATLPAVSDFVRTYHLVIAGSAMYAASAYALLASDRLRRRGWAILWGATLGLMLLSRAMIVAFVPALPVAAVWILAVDRADRRRLANFALGLAAFAGVTALWYATSWRPIFDYLTSFGYGDHSPARGPRLSVFSTDFWTDEVIGTIDLSLYVPLACVLAAAFLAALAAVASRTRSSAAAARLLRRASTSDAIVPAFVVLEGYLALSTSSNDGTGFVVPILPSLVALAVVAALRLPWHALRVALAVALAATCAFNVLMKADVVSAASEYRSIDLPGLGLATVTSGRGFFHQHLVNDAGYTLGPPTHPLPPQDRGWLPLYGSIVAPFDHPPAGIDPRLYLATSEPLLNPSAVRLAAIRRGQPAGIFEKVATGGDDSVAAYRRFLDAAKPDLLVTASRQAWHFGPEITQRRVETAARAAGFTPLEQLHTPDGRTLQLWANGRLRGWLAD
jgi:hypothetical protein